MGRSRPTPRRIRRKVRPRARKLREEPKPYGRRSDNLAMDWPWARAPKRTPDQMASSPRIGQRFNPIGLSCRLGDVLDLSASGARVRCKSKPALEATDVVRMNITNGTSRLELRARVVWVRRARESRSLFDVGLHFIELTPELTESLIEMARFGFLRPKAAGETDSSPGAKPTGSGSANTSRSGSSGASSGGSGAATATIEVEDLYAVLAVARSATKDEVHAAFRALARTLHPDRNKAADADQQFARVSKAYTILRDPEMRARYDEMLKGNRARAA